MAEEIIEDCEFCKNGRTCNIYPFTCDYGDFCEANVDCPIKKLKQENKRLKKEIEDLNFYIDSYRQVWEVDKYKSALEEIREIVTSAFAKQRPYKEDFAEIETKINEVLNLS